MKIEELKEKVGTESFDNICSLTFEAIAANEISSEEFISLMYNITDEFKEPNDDDIPFDDMDDDFDEDVDMDY
jgi:hypothetical protein